MQDNGNSERPPQEIRDESLNQVSVGQWHDIPMLEAVDTNDLPPEENRSTTGIDLEGQGLRLLSEQLAENSRPIQTICYPGCGSDATPSSAIPDANTTYIDPDPANSAKLKPRTQDEYFQQTLEAYIASHPGSQFDLVYLLNSYAPNSEAVNITRHGGLLVVNNWLGHASDFFSSQWRDKGVVLVGALIQVEGGVVRYETDNPSDSLLTVKTEAELNSYVEQIEPSLLEFYETTHMIAVPSVIRSILRNLNVTVLEGEDFVVAYRRIYDELKKTQQAKYHKEGVPDNIDIPLIINGPNRSRIEMPHLPPKMANAFLWVFEKQNKT